MLINKANQYALSSAGRSLRSRRCLRRYVHTEKPLRLVTIISISLLTFLQTVQAQDLIEFETRMAISQNEPIEAGKLADACNGRRSALWCEGYFSALLPELGISMEHPCVPPVDLARFIYSQVWMATSVWLHKQPSDSLVTMKAAVLQALTEEIGCSL